jgi:hypothetical protein
VWLTQEGDSRDHYLHANDWYRLDRDGAAVVSAMRDTAIVSFTPLREDRRARRIVLSGEGSQGPLQMFPRPTPEGRP